MNKPCDPYGDYKSMPEDFSVQRYLSGDYDKAAWHGDKSLWPSKRDLHGPIHDNANLFLPEEVWHFVPHDASLEFFMFYGCWMNAYRSRHDMRKWMFVMTTNNSFVLKATSYGAVTRVGSVFLNWTEVERQLITDELKQRAYVYLEAIAGWHKEPAKWLNDQLYTYHIGEFISRHGTNYRHKVSP